MKFSNIQSSKTFCSKYINIILKKKLQYSNSTLTIVVVTCVQRSFSYKYTDIKILYITIQ